MDLWTIQVKDVTIRNPIFSSSMISLSIPEKSSSISGKLGELEFRFLKRKVSTSPYHRSLVVRATSKKSNNDSSASSGSGFKFGSLFEFDELVLAFFDLVRNLDCESSSLILTIVDPCVVAEGDASQDNKPSNGNKSAPKSFGLSRDWREFRANLFMKEQEEKAEAEGHNKPDTVSHESEESIGLKWAHPIPFPETGCVLVATEKLDGYRTFERTVVLLVRAGTRHPQEGPFGVVINRPLHKNIKHMESTKTELATTFSDCSLHFGGPLEATMFLLKTGDKTKIPGFEEVMPGLNFGTRNSLDEAAVLVKKGILKPQDFRFFVGYAGWQLDQLRQEIELDYWHVAACSSDLICGASSENLWEEILQLMGGQYSELSRKPKLDI